MNIQQMLKQAQQLQKKMAETQEVLSKKTYEATSGGSMVKVLINGKMEIQSIKIDKEIVDPNDIEMLEDLVLSAVNSAIEKAQADQQGAMSGITGGMKLPGMP